MGQPSLVRRPADSVLGQNLVLGALAIEKTVNEQVLAFCKLIVLLHEKYLQLKWVKVNCVTTGFRFCRMLSDCYNRQEKCCLGRG